MADTDATKLVENDDKKSGDGSYRKSSRFKRKKRRDKPFMKSKKPDKASAAIKFKGTEPKMR
eukprot:CAMPEP_0198274190 /NCGR_PEP_ID=MMETSP1447-20131203/59474_1 /TAXON_ID=420782 /ORGANISM="Chaetoceros dichaeta, Strain CCMP1751" /LENGTH=61 /DNA_ID=CAMNT_0043968219 /DNA_START=149 /DNA_END=334 /DNA_ORIENTATION=+